MSIDQALRIEQADDKRTHASIQPWVAPEPSDGEVRIAAHWSSLNYKDALAVTGKGRILRRFPLNAGIDVSGVVEASRDPRFAAGDPVLITGRGLSETRDGGLATTICVSADCVVPLPAGLQLREAMQYGTAGFTAGLATLRLLDNGQHPDLGPVAVTGATGGVGSFAVAMLSALGYSVHALTRKAEAADYLKGLGAAEVLAPASLGIGDRRSNRLFDQHMDAPLQQGDAQIGMGAVGRGNHGRVQPGVGKGLGAGHGRCAIGLGHAFRDHGIGVEHMGQLYVANVGQHPGMVAAHDTGAGHTDLQNLHRTYPL
mgnify:CR=1 FL=1